ncbi:aldose 1-epimerase family protein [Photobacterium sagamiensis]|uniref:aldose 1-epimerase family protein n=1 Tax=Photobacterium sagamiensis TaxID=2910241 RepID=UPI003D1342B7
MIYFPLYKELFTRETKMLLDTNGVKVSAFKYNSGVEALKVENSQGYLIVLPYVGQMIWDARFKGIDMCMENMFSEPKAKNTIIETYGCFAFHSGIIRNGCPSPQDDHPLHGEMPCAAMDKAWLEIDGDKVSVKGEYEYVMGFGDHYLASPSVALAQDSSLFKICMTVKNLASVPMPLQYMCHMNTAYFENATLSQNIPNRAIQLRESIPAHVKPTPSWLDFNQTLKQSSTPINCLNTPEFYDPEIVYFMDDLSKYSENLEFKMELEDGRVLITKFNSSEFNFATRWILYNGDQKVGAYVLPATCRPEGYLAAKESGSLIVLETGGVRTFTVETGVL